MKVYSPEPALRNPKNFARQILTNLQNSWTTATLLFLANIRSRHRRAFFGYAWILIPGIAASFALTFLRNNAFFAVGEVSIPYPLFVLSGMFLWQTFVDGLTSPIRSLKQQSYFLSIVPAPYDGIIISAFFDALFNLFIRVSIFMCSLVIFGQDAVFEWLFMPLSFLLLLFAGFSLGLALAPAVLLYDDIGHLVGMFATFGIFVVPVIYPLPRLSFLATNPLALVMDATRAWMLGSHPLTDLLPTIAFALIVFPFGWILTSLSRPHLAGRSH